MYTRSRISYYNLSGFSRRWFNPETNITSTAPQYIKVVQTKSYFFGQYSRPFILGDKRFFRVMPHLSYGNKTSLPFKQTPGTCQITRSQKLFNFSTEATQSSSIRLMKHKSGTNIYLVNILSMFGGKHKKIREFTIDDVLKKIQPSVIVLGFQENETKRNPDYEAKHIYNQRAALYEELAKISDTIRNYDCHLVYGGSGFVTDKIREKLRTSKSFQSATKKAFWNLLWGFFKNKKLRQVFGFSAERKEAKNAPEMFATLTSGFNVVLSYFPHIKKLLDDSEEELFKVIKDNLTDTKELVVFIPFWSMDGLEKKLFDHNESYNQLPDPPLETSSSTKH